MKHNFQNPMQPPEGLSDYARTVKVKGMDIHLYDAGPQDRPALLLVHGLGDEADSWRHVITPLSENYRMIAPDLPGFGRSSKPRLPYTLDFFCETILGLMDTLLIQDAVLVGSSLGGMIVHRIALDQPARTSQLILVGGSLVATSQTMDIGILLFLIPGLGEWLYTRLRRDPQSAYETLHPYYADLDGLPEADREFLFQRVNERVWSDGQRRAYFSTLRRAALSASRGQADLNEKISRSKTPMLLIWGGEDNIMPVANAHALIELQPEARLVTIPQTGHLPHQESPREFLDTLEAHLEVS